MIQTPHGLEVLGPVSAQQSEILTPGALEFFCALEREFNPSRLNLLHLRKQRRQAIERGERPALLPETQPVREGQWRVAPVPEDLQDRRVEITGPVDRKMVINALNSGANCYMADFEDSHSPTWSGTLEGQINVRDAVRGTIEYTSPEGKSYKLNHRVATLLVRPRGWHLEEKNIAVDGEVASASLFDFAMYFYHNARHRLEHDSGVYFYLPKMEHYLEARLWNDVFVKAQRLLGIPLGTVKATVLIEHVLAAFQMEEILYELRHHSAGLNCGRWDYIFSFIKTFAAQEDLIMPDRAQVTMTTPFLRAYTLACIRTCHKRHTFAMGGMAAYIPIKGDWTANERALQKVREDKRREAADGHDGTWVAHPGLVSIAKEEFDQVLGAKPNQIDRLRDDVGTAPEQLLEAPKGSITEEGLRNNICVAIQYLEAWLNGQGCVPLYNLMEDAATAEISRTQVWQWVHHRRGVLAEGRKITVELVRQCIQEELARIRGERGAERFESGRFAEAAQLFDELVTSDTLDDFLTLKAYELLEHHKAPSGQPRTHAGPAREIHPALPPPFDALAEGFHASDGNGALEHDGSGIIWRDGESRESNGESDSRKTRLRPESAWTGGGNHRDLPSDGVWTDEVKALEACWRNDPRWRGVTRNYNAEKVLRLRGTLKIEHTIAERMSRKLWQRLHAEPYINALGALTGNQAVQMVQAGLKAIYLSGWQVAADNNLAGSMYPDQSLYPCNSVPEVIRRINRALQRADQIQLMNNQPNGDMWAPIVADAEAGFGGALNAYELVLQMIEQGAAGIHLEDQLASAKKCGHMGGKVLVPGFEFIHKLRAARLAADVADVPVVLVARTDADSAKLLTSDFDERDKPFCSGERTEEGFFHVRAGIELAIARAVRYAPFADMLWCETGKPDLDYARRFAEAVKKVYPEKLLAYNCSPSFNWKKNLDDSTIARFQTELAAMGYKFQFVTLAGFHALNYSMWELARGFGKRQMAAYTELQQKEFAAERDGYRAVKHQSFVGTGYFDEIAAICGEASTQALHESTEETQFEQRSAVSTMGAKARRGEKSRRPAHRAK
jgi:malate synthase